MGFQSFLFIQDYKVVWVFWTMLMAAKDNRVFEYANMVKEIT